MLINKTPIASTMPLFENNETLIPLCHPSVETSFLLGQSRNKTGRAQWLAANPSYINRPLQQLPASGNLRIKMSKEASQAERNHQGGRKDTPKFWAIRLDHAVNEDKQAAIRTAYDIMLGENPLWHGKHGTEDIRHGDFWRPTYHFGHWFRQSNPPQISADTIQGNVNAKTQVTRQAAILRFCGNVSAALEDLAGRIANYDKPAFTRQKFICANADQHSQNQLQPLAVKAAKKSTGCKKPLGLGKLGTMLAATTGQSEMVHIDPNDSGYTLVMPIAANGWGDQLLPTDQLWGQVELPQLGYRLPLRPGQILIFRASNLLHRVTPLPFNCQDHRLALTIFVCNYLAEEVFEANQGEYQGVPMAGPSFYGMRW